MYEIDPSTLSNAVLDKLLWRTVKILARLGFKKDPVKTFISENYPGRKRFTREEVDLIRALTVLTSFRANVITFALIILVIIVGIYLFMDIDSRFENVLMFGD